MARGAVLKTVGRDERFGGSIPLSAAILKKEKHMGENWIWVDGYKFTDENMQGHGRFQYELNKIYHQDGKIKICENGFHFSLTLKDAYNYIPYNIDWFKARFFKCEALVREEDKLKYGTSALDPYYGSIETVDKLVAKEILLTEVLIQRMF